MLSTDSIGWWNTGLPLVVLGALAAMLPLVFGGRRASSQGRLAFAILSSATLLLIIGALIFAGFSADGGARVLEAWEAEPKLTAAVFLGMSAYAILVWGPILALVWFALAQGVEARKGAALAARER